ncbi:flavin monoamine oxidase family protein [Spirulina subsalsa]|uniref:flavin monoamine oxidase family protein n=1 Tax=Spirulina subsalsa TaxID=54311 RepID=UPI0002D83315|nr:NAD(P)/FAD-dependent oxidoreductase [Spirulina subsalsa]
MTRSLLLRTLRQVYQVARQSQNTGMTTAEVIGQAQERGQRQGGRLSRRRLLQGGLALGSALLATQCRRLPLIARPGSASVLVVGAGMAGLTAAYRLKQAGVRVDMIEARGRVGGRIQTLHNALGSGIPVELGAEFIDSDHLALLTWAEELGLEVVDIYGDGGDLSPVYSVGGQSVPVEQLVEEFAPAMGRIAKDLKAIADFEDYQNYNPATARLDNTSIAQYLQNLPISESVRRLLENAYTAEYGLDVQDVSALGLLFEIGSEAEDFDPFVYSEERYYIPGGMEQLPQRLARLLEDELETRVALEAIRTLPDGRYQVTVRTHPNVLSDRTYERVILAVPLPVLAQVDFRLDLPPLKKQAIAQLGYGTNAKLITRYSQNIWQDRYGANGSSVSDSGHQVTWESTQSFLTPEAAVLTNFVGGSRGLALAQISTAEATNQLLQELEVIFPGITDVQLLGQATKIHWSSVPYSYGSYSCFKVGQYTQFYGALGQSVGNLHFAGEHTSLEYSGYMEGACDSGERVALEVLEAMGLRPEANAQKARFQQLGAARRWVRERV